MSRRKKEEIPAIIHQELEGFSIHVDAFGKIQTSLPIDKINEFLNENTQDIKIHNTRKKRETK
jgi:S-adenosylmethionine hydrolase